VQDITAVQQLLSNLDDPAPPRRKLRRTTQVRLILQHGMGTCKGSLEVQRLA
jgi:hypothetical protein